jgi:hypothetical protein
MRIRHLLVWGASSVALVIAAQGAGAAAPAAAPAGPPAAPATHSVARVVQSISCPSKSVCYTLSQHVNNSRWAVTRLEHKGASAHTKLISHQRNAVAISCPSAIGCEVFGIDLLNGKPAIYPVSKGGTPGDKHVLHAPGAIDVNTIGCRPSRKHCVLVGGLGHVVDIVTASGAKSTSHHVTLPSSVKSVVITSLSCPSASFCEAVGWVRTSRGIEGLLLPIHHGVGGGWAMLGSAAGGFSAVACPSAAHCYATGVGKKQDFIETVSKITYSQSISLPVGVRLKGIACISARGCYAVGAYTAAESASRGVIVAVHSGAPGKPQITSVTTGYTAIGGYQGGFLAVGIGPHGTTVISAH